MCPSCNARSKKADGYFRTNIFIFIIVRLSRVETLLLHFSLQRHLHRFFRFLRFSNGLQIIKYTLIASSKELMLLALLLLLPVAFFATVVYFCEREVCFHTSTWWSKLLVSKIIKHNPRKHTTSFWRCNNVVPCLLECWKSYPLNSMSIIWLKRNHISEIKLLNVGTERPRSNVQRTLFLNNISFHLENYSI